MSHVTVNFETASDRDNASRSPRGSCDRCHERLATMWWVADGGALALVHGMAVSWCEICVLEEQLRHARAQAARIWIYEARLIELHRREFLGLLCLRASRG